MICLTLSSKSVYSTLKACGKETTFFKYFSKKVATQYE
ncbi:hypothetical protein HPHPH16_1315 [Helicobacter pylori Hp H-16]|uniref:Uncharacterized protein n=2 Tax=Helicobacter pylori TaxID=210 RepID=J0N3K6_HELPX|nr:hypothetical protein HPHPH16_1315 [Helicobacter pylori Hp H-16]EJB80982.1 hypothetical protein HPHPH6_1355 [Helicobacter pylori Hp H-6]EJC00739.1 hypothetical protein HPHPP4_1429 [Helicobacter pylori Hp P-4]EJC24022.1 hypothetical protein HPHPP4D_1080 [Helicobacter pylori Hp P-4d]